MGVDELVALVELPDAAIDVAKQRDRAGQPGPDGLGVALCVGERAIARVELLGLVGQDRSPPQGPVGRGVEIQLLIELDIAEHRVIGRDEPEALHDAFPLARSSQLEDAAGDALRAVEGREVEGLVA